MAVDRQCAMVVIVSGVASFSVVLTPSSPSPSPTHCSVIELAEKSGGSADPMGRWLVNLCGDGELHRNNVVSGSTSG